MKPEQHRLCPIRITRKSIVKKIFNRSLSLFFRSDFRGIIDYVFYAKQSMRVLGVLGPLDPEWLQSNKIVGCPHPHIPSDHFSLLVEFELNPVHSIDSNPSPMIIRRP